MVPIGEGVRNTKYTTQIPVVWLERIHDGDAPCHTMQSMLGAFIKDGIPSLNDKKSNKSLVTDWPCWDPVNRKQVRFDTAGCAKNMVCPVSGYQKRQCNFWKRHKQRQAAKMLS